MTDQPIADRLSLLERRVGRWRAVSIAALGLAAATLAAGAGRDARADRSVAEEIAARRIVVVDAQGTPRVLLGVDGGDAFIGMRDGRETTRVLLQASDGGARLLLADGIPRLVLDTRGVGALAAVNGPDGRPRAVLGLGADGRESLVLSGIDGRPTATLP
ncbi:MAG: hypothetical protein AB7P02_14405 [Alphaproteobacteria bacterium]